MDRCTLHRPAWLGRLVLMLGLMGASGLQAQPVDLDLTFPVEAHHRALDVSALVRLNSQTFEVRDDRRAVQRVHYAVTIFDADGREEGVQAVGYDNTLYHLKAFRGQVRDATGRVVRKLKKGDIRDVSAISGYSLYEENRVRYAELYHSVYPYTVEFTYELALDGLVGWPAWSPQQGDLGVEYASFTLITPEELAFSHAMRNLTVAPTVARKRGRVHTDWVLRDLAPVDREPMSPHWTETAPVVLVSPDHFEVEGTRGSMTSWATFGAWYHLLSEGRDVLPAATVSDIQALTARLPTTTAKAEAVYRYLQDRTRYVSVQLGLGGWQTYDAAYVDERGYGDCKALTNYLMALLDAADVTAYPALIHNGRYRETVVDSFVTNRFNHAILHVPGEGDEEDLWLEATSQTMPFGHIGASNEGRLALVVTPQGGVLRRTPQSTATENRQARRAEIRLDGEGNARADLVLTYSGNQQDPVRGATALASGADRMEWLQEALSVPTFDVVEADFSAVEQRAPVLELPVTIQVPRYAGKTGQRLFLPVNMLERWSYVPPAVSERIQPVRHALYAFEDTDTLVYTLPLGYRVEAMPKAVNLKTDFGTYVSRVEVVDEGQLVYHRTVAFHTTHVPADRYEDYRAFRRQMAQADQAQVVLVLDATDRPHAVDGQDN
ncbi:MAG: DUF3857 domain-containing protein [Bacteroidota bacterium]